MARRTGYKGHVLGCMLAAACGGAPAERGLEGRSGSKDAPTPAAEDPAAAEARRLAESAHRVVFADRITYSYVLLLPGPPGPAPTRAEVQSLARTAFAAQKDEPEVELLLDFIGTPPPRDLGELRLPGAEAAPKDSEDPPLDAEAAARVHATGDLLGLEFAAVGAGAIDPAALQDPELTRGLTEAERASLPGRQRLVVVRATYRNQRGVRGLRLLQAVVRVLASERGALIHDPDTLETAGAAAFAARRLQTGLGNVADQIVVVPFPDPRRGPDAVRLTTRGMRRFGSVDLELDGLPQDLPVLQQATYFLHGLALVMVRTGEFDAAGFAVEAPDVLTLHYRDCVTAYAGARLPRCADCPEQVELHLVERAAEPQDPLGHVVARVVAPRVTSDRPDYDPRAWSRQALARLFGPA